MWLYRWQGLTSVEVILHQGSEIVREPIQALVETLLLLLVLYQQRASKIFRSPFAHRSACSPLPWMVLGSLRLEHLRCRFLVCLCFRRNPFLNVKRSQLTKLSYEILVIELVNNRNGETTAFDHLLLKNAFSFPPPRNYATTGLGRRNISERKGSKAFRVLRKKQLRRGDFTGSLCRLKPFSNQTKRIQSDLW